MWYWYELYFLGLLGTIPGYLINIWFKKTDFWKKMGLFK